jgi:hypothetical protein
MVDDLICPSCGREMNVCVERTPSGNIARITCSNPECPKNSGEPEPEQDRNRNNSFT